MCAHSSEVLEALATVTTRFVELPWTMLEQHVLLKVVALFEANETHDTNVGPFVRMGANVVSKVGVLRKVFRADRTRPLCGSRLMFRRVDVATDGGDGRQRRRKFGGGHLVQSDVHTEVLPAGELTIAHGTPKRA